MDDARARPDARSGAEKYGSTRTRSAPASATGGDRRRRASRWLPLAGLAYLVLDLLGNSVIASLPGAPGSDVAPVAPFLERHGVALVLMAWCIAAAATCLAVFAVGLRRALSPGLDADIVAAAGVMAGSMLAVSQAVMLAAGGGRDRGEDQAGLLWDLWNAGAVALLPAAALVLATSRNVQRSGGPRWVWRTGLPLAVLCVLPPYLGFVTLKLFPLWLAALSISLIRGRRWSGELHEGPA